MQTLSADVRRVSEAPMIQVPRLVSHWLLAACLFFVPLTAYRVTSYISYCDVFFAAAILAGVIERVGRKDLELDRFESNIFQVYLLAGALFLLCFLVNAFEHSVVGYGLQTQAPLGVPGRLPDAATLLFGGSAPQNPLFIMFLINTVMVPLAMFALPRCSSGELRFLVIAWSAGCLYGAGYGVAYVHGFLPGVFDRPWVQLRRLMGLSAHPNSLGMTSVMAMISLLMVISSRASLLVKACTVPLFWLIWVTVDYSGSRTALVAFFVLPLAFLVMLGESWRKRIERGAVFATLGIAAWFVLLEVYRGEGAFYRLRFGGQSSNFTRDLVNRLSWEQALESPLFGNGFQVLRIAHNIFLQIFHAAGAVGLIAYLVLMFLPLSLLLRQSTKVPREQLSLVAAVTAVMAVVVLVSVFKNSQTDLSITIVYAMSLYTVVSLRRKRL